MSKNDPIPWPTKVATGIAGKADTYVGRAYAVRLTNALGTPIKCIILCENDDDVSTTFSQLMDGATPDPDLVYNAAMTFSRRVVFEGDDL